MTEKRFTLAYEKGNWWAVRDRDITLWKEEVVGLLNELSDVCDFLKIENEALEDGATKYAELYHKSLKENEQLKKALMELKEIGDYQEGRIKELNDENDQLQEELEQCKAVINKKWSEYLQKKEEQEND